MVDTKEADRFAICANSEIMLPNPIEGLGKWTPCDNYTGKEK